MSPYSLQTLLTNCLRFIASSGKPGVKVVRLIQVILRSIQLQSLTPSVRRHLLQFQVLAVQFFSKVSGALCFQGLAGGLSGNATKKRDSLGEI